MRLAAALLAGSLFLTWSAHCADWDVTRLFESLAAHRPERAAFKEKKFFALLDRPVESSGELQFTPPDRLEKRTVLPKPESVVVEGDMVTLERGGKRRTMRLSDNQQVAVLVESLRATLAGDLRGLTRTYSAQLEGSPSSWRLLLRPLDPALGTLVERIAFAGDASGVRNVEIFQADGDRSVMAISPLAK